MPPHVPPPHPPLARRQKRRPGMWPWVLVVAVLLVGLVVLVSLLAADTAGPAPAPTQPSAPAVPPVDEGIGDGTWIVGVDITPGTYGGGARPGELCTASTHRGPSGDSDLIDRVAATDTPAVIEVGDDARSLVTAGCQPWQLIA